MNQKRSMAGPVRYAVSNGAGKAPVIIFHDHVPIQDDLSRLKQGGVTAKFYNISIVLVIELTCEVAGAPLHLENAGVVTEEGWESLTDFDTRLIVL